VVGLIFVCFEVEKICHTFCDRQMLKKSAFGFVSGGLMFLLVFLLYTAFKSGGDLTVLSPIIQLSFIIFTSALCFIFLKDKFNIRKLAGLFLAVISIVIISL
jgi:drug/metabolite transporter (DMT)-like permease